MQINYYNINIAVAGTGYVGLSIATLLAQHNHVTAVDIIQEKVDLINNKKSPIQDDYIEKYLAEKDLDLTATVLFFYQCLIFLVMYSFFRLFFIKSFTCPGIQLC